MWSRDPITTASTHAQTVSLPVQIFFRNKKKKVWFNYVWLTGFSQKVIGLIDGDWEGEECLGWTADDFRFGVFNLEILAGGGGALQQAAAEISWIVRQIDYTIPGAYVKDMLYYASCTPDNTRLVGLMSSSTHHFFAQSFSHLLIFSSLLFLTFLHISQG